MRTPRRSRSTLDTQRGAREAVRAQGRDACAVLELGDVAGRQGA